MTRLAAAFLSVLVPVLVSLVVASPAARAAQVESAVGAYSVHAFDGRSFEVDTLAQLDGRPALLTGNGVVVLEPGSIDYYETFRANLARPDGNVVVFQSGRFLRYEALELRDGKATIRVGGGSAFVVDEHLIDYRASVLEGATIQLPRGVGELGVAKADSRGSRRSAVSRVRGSTPRATRSAADARSVLERRRAAAKAARERVAERRRLRQQRANRN